MTTPMFLGVNIYPVSVDLSPITKKASFFLGDRWIEIGELSVGRQQGETYVVLPDIPGFFAEREGLEDGTKEWLDWGPRVN